MQPTLCEMSVAGLRTEETFGQIRDRATDRGGGGGERGVCSGVGVTNCRGFEPEIFRLRGKGVSTKLVRMDQFIHNLGLVLCDSTGVTVSCVHCTDQRIYISDRTHSIPQRLPKMCPRNLSPPHRERKSKRTRKMSSFLFFNFPRLYCSVQHHGTL